LVQLRPPRCRLYQAVKDRFAKEKKNKEAAKTLKQFEKNPKEWTGPMKSALTDIMTKDPEFLTLLEKLVNESEAASRKAGTENNFKIMVTGGYVGKIVDIGTVNGDVHF
jgi:transcriptional regulator with AAA-type ATPase domain